SKIKKYLSESRGAPRCENLRLEELASLVAGVKQVVYTSISGSADARVMAEMCADLKLEKIALDYDRNIYKDEKAASVLIGTDGGKLRAAAKHYNSAVSGRAKAEAEYEWGADLGYPQCCVKAFGKWQLSLDREDLIFHIFSGSQKNTPVSFLMNNVCSYFSRLVKPEDPADCRAFKELNRGSDLDAVLPWHPCSYNCAASLAGAGKIYEVLAHYMPHLAASRRDRLSKPVIFWDKFLFAVLDGSCRREGGGISVSYEKVCGPRSLLSPETRAAVDRHSRLRISAAGSIVSPRAPRLPGKYIFLPFTSGGFPAAGPSRGAGRTGRGERAG
ncbi:MAG TPA: hypothetical protein PKI19_10260, partial [Elusimicrobiales bacterium]|nr:hypothetical protein [Elusimicrobiales bacterium]